ncbi:MAG: hypothetical protein H5T64_12770 [Chloroflexi bacterium]|nr:hypothetical protein [Chloroflexota bacterium]
MVERFKLTVWGGSGVATPELIDALRHEMGDLAIDVVLWGRNPEKLELVGGVCRRMAEASGRDLGVTWTTNPDEAVEGAHYVLNQIRVGGMSGRAFDETFPRDFGIPGEETVGPGGFSNALRTIPVVLKHCRHLEQVAPQAILLNLTNPSSLVQYAITRYSKVHVLGLCDAPVTLMRGIAELLGVPYEECSFDYFGMHHFGWVTGVWWNGQDLMPRALERIEDLPKLEVEPELVRAMGAVPHPYLKYYLHPDRMLAKTMGRPCRAEELIAWQERALEFYRRWDSGEKPAILAQRGAVWYQEIIVPALLSMMRDDGRTYVVNVTNNGLVSWLPPEAIIEVPCTVGRAGAHPLAPADVPPDIRAMIQVNCAYEIMAVEAIVEGSYEKALRALMLNPMVRDYRQAKGILEFIWPER